MVKPTFGTKRLCQNCGARFYDLNKPEIICPKCSTPFNPEALLKSRRASVPEDEAEEDKKTLNQTDLDDDFLDMDNDEDDIIIVDDEDTIEADDEDEENTFIEDPSELGDDDMSADIDTRA